jgi:hypothetical protein
MDSTINHENCIVQELDESHCFVCLAGEQDRSTCPFASDFGFSDVFCAHPDRVGFQRK